MSKEGLHELTSLKSPSALLFECRSWEDFRGRLADLPGNKRLEKFKGDCFELLVEHYLHLTPKYQSQLRSVWGRVELPERVRTILRLPKDDEGIDLVAETHDGRYWAIQCKYRQDEEHSTTLREVATFLALCAGRGFELALLCTSADRYSGKLKHHENLQFCAGDVWRELDAEFFERLHRALRGETVPPPKPKIPMPHQNAAIDAAKNYFDGGRTRGKLIMPCGTGKSLTAFWIAERLEAKKILVAVPSLALVRQMLHTWLREYVANGNRPRWIAVCSDETVASRERDDPEPSIWDLGVAVHTDPETVAEWLSAHQDEDRTIVFTTYHSGRVTTAAAKRAGFAFDFGVFDEAHKTAGRKAGVFAHLLRDENVQVANRLFMTATERRYEGNSDDIVSMDDEEAYGATAHKLTFKAALESKVLCDYQVLLVECRREDVEDLIRERALVLPKGEQWNLEVEADTLAAALTLRRIMVEHPVRHALSFHSSVARARRFKALQEALTTAFPQHGALDVYHVSGKTPTAVRSRELAQFEQSERGLVTNARCLTEGVDIPAIDCILFADPRQSVIDIVQAVGRAMRPWSGKEIGYVLVPVMLDEGEKSLSDQAFLAVLRVLRALAENDERVVAYFRAASEGKRWTGRKLFEADSLSGLIIDESAFDQALGARVWERLAKLSWRPFHEARALVHGLGLRSHREWQAYCKTDSRPADLPTAPYKIYKGAGWKSFGDWLGTGSVAPSKREFRPFEEARAFVHSLGLESEIEWQAYAHSDQRPDDIPTHPSRTYGDAGWVDWGDWLGTGAVAPSKREFRPFEQAREFVRGVGLRSQSEWQAYAKSDERPGDIPSNPQTFYSKENGWVSMGDWLGTGSVKRGSWSYRPFAEARSFARGLGLRSRGEWATYSKTGQLPEDIPANPSLVYGKPRWKGWGDWLGTGTVASFKRRFRAFEEAREFVHGLGLKGQKEWQAYARTDQRPADIPANPARVYAAEGWSYWGDWLGTGSIAHSKREFRPFEEARAFVQSLGLKSQGEWREYSRSDQRPADVPSNPDTIYRDDGWAGWGDWLRGERRGGAA